MTATTPREKAERCFAVARRATFPGEVENAISRGKAICERHGLDLDGFDIPGRVRAKPKAAPRPGSRYAAFHEYGKAASGASRPVWGSPSRDELEEMLRREVEKGLRQARERTMWKMRQALAEDAAEYLNTLDGFIVAEKAHCAPESPRWNVAYRGRIAEATADQLIAAAEEARRGVRPTTEHVWPGRGNAWPEY